MDFPPNPATDMPPEETDRRYSAVEVRRIIEQELMRARVAEVERDVRGMRDSVKEGFVEFRAVLASLERKLTDHNSQTIIDRRELRLEIERDFVTTTAFTAKFSELEGKVDKMWVRISSAVTVAVVLVEFLARWVFR